MVAHLLAVPAGSDAELEPSAREVVDARHGLRGDDRVVLGHKADPAPDAELRRRSRRGRQGDELVVAMPVLGRQVRSTRAPALAARRDVRVLGEEQALEAVLLHQPPELCGRDGVVRREHRQADLHIAPLRFPPESSLPADRRRYCGVGFG